MQEQTGLRQDEDFERKDGALLVDGLSEQPGRQFGTPSYIYSGARFAGQLPAICQSLLGLDCQIHFAVKANSALGVIRCWRAPGAGADIVSGGELETGFTRRGGS